MSEEATLLPDDYQEPSVSGAEDLSGCAAGENVGRDCASGSLTGTAKKVS